MMIPWWRRNLLGWRVRGLTLLSSSWYPDGRRWHLAAYHHPQRMCWLWFFEFQRTRRLWPRFYRFPGHQSKTVLELPFCYFLFCWQDQGRYTDPSDERMRKFAGVSQWPKEL